MKPRAIYYRKKGNSIVIEGRQGRKSVLIWTLPKPEVLLSRILSNPSLFTEEKMAKINEKITRLDYKSERGKKTIPKVRIPVIKRTPNKDGISEELNKTLYEITK